MSRDRDYGLSRGERERLRGTRQAPSLTLRAAHEGDRAWIRSLLSERWAGPEIVTRGRVHLADRLPGWIAFEGERPVGLVTYIIEGADCEIVSLDALVAGKGVGSALVREVLEAARAEGCRRAWLVTTNDNTSALRFYQKIGFEIVAVHVGSILEARAKKPCIPEVGCDGIPIRDEIELQRAIG